VKYRVAIKLLHIFYRICLYTCSFLPCVYQFSF